MSDPQKEAAQLARTLLQRFVGTQPDALTNMRDQVRGELEYAEAQVRRLQAELEALEQVVSVESDNGMPDRVESPPPLRKAVMIVLQGRPGYWSRDEIMAELKRRGWAPGGKKPRNTLISRLAEMAADQQIERMGDGFGVADRTEVPA